MAIGTDKGTLRTAARLAPPGALGNDAAGPADPVHVP
jgi:hypothetical protein